MSTPAELIARYTNQGQLNSYFTDKLGIYSVLSYAKGSTVYDGTTSVYQALYDTIQAIPTSGGIIVFPSTTNGGTYKLSTNITIPSNVTLWFIDGAKIKIASGISLTGASSKIIAGLYQIFDLSLGGTVGGSWNISEVYPEWFGAVKDNDCTDAIQKAYNFLVNGIGGKIKFSNGIYYVTKISMIAFKGTSVRDDMKVIFEGVNRFSTFLKSLNGADTEMFLIEGLSIFDDRIYRIIFRDIGIEGVNTNNTQKGKKAFMLKNATRVVMENVFIDKIKGIAIDFLDVHDCEFHNVEIEQCGYWNTDSDYAYCLDFRGVNDNTNATKWTNCRLEITPLFLRADVQCRHNMFTNCKFEKAVPNYSDTLRPFYFKDCLNFSFVNCFYVNSEQTFGFTGIADEGRPYFVVNDSLTSYAIDKNIDKFILISDSEFICPGDTTSNWFEINYTTLDNCMIQKCEGSTPTLTLGKNCKLNVELIIENGTHALEVNNENNTGFVKVNYKDSGSSGALVGFGVDADKNNIKIFKIGEYDQPYAGTYPSVTGGSYLKENKIIIDNFIQHTDDSSTTPNAIWGIDLIFSTCTTSIVYIEFGYIGQVVTIYSNRAAGITIANLSTKIVTKTGSDLGLSYKDSAKFILKSDGVWYQI